MAARIKLSEEFRDRKRTATSICFRRHEIYDLGKCVKTAGRSKGVHKVQMRKGP